MGMGVVGGRVSERQCIFANNANIYDILQWVEYSPHKPKNGEKEGSL